MVLILFSTYFLICLFSKHLFSKFIQQITNECVIFVRHWIRFCFWCSPCSCCHLYTLLLSDVCYLVVSPVLFWLLFSSELTGNPPSPLMALTLTWIFFFIISSDILHGSIHMDKFMLSKNYWRIYSLFISPNKYLSIYVFYIEQN